MESNFGGFTDKGLNEFIQTMRDLLAYKVLQNSLGGYVDRKFYIRKEVCAVDEVVFAMFINAKRIACHITNNSSVTVYLRHDDGPTNNVAATIINYGYPLGAGKSMSIEGTTNIVYATPDGGSLDLRIVEIIDDEV